MVSPAPDPQDGIGGAPSLDDGDRWDRIVTAAENQATLDRQRWDKFVRLFRDGQFNAAPGTSNKTVNANYTFSNVILAMSLLYANDPLIEVEPNDIEDAPSIMAFAPLITMGLYADGDAAVTDYAETLEKFLTYSYKETCSAAHNQYSLFQGLVRGMGVTKESFDEIRMIDRCDALRRDELFIDPHARFHLSQAGYVVQTCVLGIERARRFFSVQGVTQGIEPNYDLEDQEGLAGEKAKENVVSSNEKAQFKFYEIWWHDGDRRRLDYRAFRKQNWLLRRDWPFKLDADDFPYSTLVFQNQGEQISDAFTDRHVTDSLRETMDKILQFGKQHTMRSLAKKIIFNKDVIDDIAEKALKDPQDMRFVGVKVPEGTTLAQHVFKLDFNSEPDASMESAAEFKQIHDEVGGMDEMMKGLASRDMSATQADIMDKYGKAKSSRKQSILDSFLETQCRHRAMIAVQLVPPEKIARVVGKKAALLWTLHTGDAEDITGEFTVGIAAGSSGERAKQQRIERMQREIDQAGKLNADRGAMGMPPKFDIEQMMLDLWKQDGQRRPERYVLPEPPPMLPPPMQQQQQAPNVVQGQFPQQGQQQMLPFPEQQAQG